MYWIGSANSSAVGRNTRADASGLARVHLVSTSELANASLSSFFSRRKRSNPSKSSDPARFGGTTLSLRRTGKLPVFWACLAAAFQRVGEEAGDEDADEDESGADE